VPVAAGVRNYRMSCIVATHFRDGGRCVECVGTVLNSPAVRHACYRESRLASVPLAFSQAVHAGTWRLVDRFLAVSDFLRDHLVRLGVAASRVTVRPNFSPDYGVAPGLGRDVLFAGRLTPDKGVEPLLEAWRRSRGWHTGRLLLAGTGPLEPVARAVEPRYRVSLLGLLDREQVIEAMRASRLVVMPSIWDEPFGRVVVEAASLGRPSIVSDRGALPSLVEDGTTGWVRSPDPASLATAFDAALDDEEVRRRGRAARRRYERHYTEERSIDVLDATLHQLARRPGTSLPQP
jgi:glycosyltransferase involved in cell wall biosynthesis